jgi:hypothetical protein
MKIPLGGGAFIEPDEGERKSQFHKRIVTAQPIPNTRSGNWCQLECGHVVQTFGDLKLADGVALCIKCRDEGEARGRA